MQDVQLSPRGKVRVLLVGPYDPSCGEYTFLAPPLGVWRLAGVLMAEGHAAEVFDPNNTAGDPRDAFERVLDQPWDVIGFSTTGMTLRYDLSLAHAARRRHGDALLVAGGMEATFAADMVLKLGPFDLAVLGEGEKPLLELCRRLQAGAEWHGVAGTAAFAGARLVRLPQAALTREEMRDATFLTPYERMPYEAYWTRLENAYRVGRLFHKADREARLSEIRSVRLNTLNYCPMGCTFCSSTNFLNDAQGGVAKVARLDADECLRMMRRIVGAHPTVRTIIFQDDIFVFTKDERIEPLCRGIVDAKRRGELPAELQFISTNRIDAMTPERLRLLREAGFRVLGFGVENASAGVLREFGKARIHPFIEPALRDALALGITPFLDMILASPRSTLGDLAENVRFAFRWTTAGCEVGMYPYVIPFSGAAMASDPELEAHTVTAVREIDGTGLRWEQPAKILPVDPVVRQAVLDIEGAFDRRMLDLEPHVVHLPSRIRSFLWNHSALPVLEALVQQMPSRDDVSRELLARLPMAGGASDTGHGRPAVPAPASVAEASA